MSIVRRSTGMLFVLLATLGTVPISAAGPAPSKFASLANCAGAVAVFGHVDPRGGGNNPRDPWFMTYAYILSDMVDISDPKKAHDAAVERWSFWKKQPMAATAGKAKTCKAGYP